MIKITSHVYLSSIDALPLPICNPIPAVVSLLTPPLSSYPQLAIPPPTHLFVPLSDIPASCLLSTLKDTLPFIHAHHASGVLVHCFHGVSRSVATVLAYLIWLDPSKSLEAHVRFVQGKYPAANPSSSFLCQLDAFRAATAGLPHIYVFPPQRGALHPLEARQVLSFIKQSATPDYNRFFLDNPSKQNTSGRCRMCREPLLSDSSMSGSSYKDNTVCTLPVKWMIPSCAHKKGKLKCTCGAKIGRFDLSVPQFQILSSTIDWM